MKTTADRSEKFWHLAAMKMCELRGIAADQRIRVKQDDGFAVLQSTTAHAAAMRELKNLHQQIDALEYAENTEDMLKLVGKTFYMINEKKGLTEDLSFGAKVEIVGVDADKEVFTVMSESGEVFEVKDADLGEHDPREYDN